MSLKDSDFDWWMGCDKSDQYTVHVTEIGKQEILSNQEENLKLQEQVDKLKLDVFELVTEKNVMQEQMDNLTHPYKDTDGKPRQSFVNQIEDIEKILAVDKQDCPDCTYSRIQGYSYCSTCGKDWHTFDQTFSQMSRKELDMIVREEE